MLKNEPKLAFSFPLSISLSLFSIFKIHTTYFGTIICIAFSAYNYEKLWNCVCVRAIFFNRKVLIINFLTVLSFFRSFVRMLVIDKNFAEFKYRYINSFSSIERFSAILIFIAEKSLSHTTIKQSFSFEGI